MSDFIPDDKLVKEKFLFKFTKKKSSEQLDRKNITIKKRLNTLEMGQKCKIIKLEAKNSMRRRLQDLGFIENVELECVLKNSAENLLAFIVKGAIIALRNDDSQSIFVSITI